MSAKFKKVYRELSEKKKEIRLLLVRAGCRESPIFCDLLYTSLAESHQSQERPPARRSLSSALRRTFGRQAQHIKYETVSYAWGDQRQRGTIYVDGREFDLPANSEALLRRMRLPDRDRILWIDAVCINQADTEERSRQVAMMADIYGNTERNLIWLGEGDARNDLRISAIAKVLRDAEKETNHCEDLLVTVFKGMDAEYRAGRKAIQCKVNYEYVLQFYRSSWFTRLWVVQEAALAPQSLCYYGGYEVPLLDIARAAAWLYYKRLHLPFAFASERGLVNALTIWEHADHEQGVYCRDYRRIWDEGLMVLFTDFRHFHASDGRDHVYGALGLYARRTKRSEIPLLLSPDYKKPLSTVLRNATRFIIYERNDLACLSFVSHRSAPSGEAGDMPSWVPRWQRPWSYEQDPSDFPDRFECYGVGGGAACLATDALRKSLHPGQSIGELETRELDTLSLDTPELNTLSVGGTIIDHITSNMWSPTMKMTIKDYLANLHSIEETSIAQQDGEDGPDETLAHVLVAGSDHQQRKLSSAKAAIGYRAWIKYLQTMRSLLSFERRPQKRFSNMVPVNPAAIAYSQAFCNACLHRSVFRTSLGLLGVGPTLIRRGDIVAILWGCQWPVILRPLRGQNNYLFLGISYVGGMMDGQAITGRGDLKTAASTYAPMRTRVFNLK